MKDYFRLLQEEIYHAYQSSKLIGHSVNSGQEREVITSRFLTRHLPEFINIGQGIIVDQSTTDFSSLTQSTSPQIDILLSMSHHPSLIFYGGTRFFFAESVAAIIEVKSNLTTYKSSSSELDKILKHCDKIKQRTRQILGVFRGTPPPSKRIPYYVVAFEADKQADELISALKSRADKKRMTDEKRLLYQPDGIFVLAPENSAVILKHIPDHEIRPSDFCDSCFAGGSFPNGGVLLGLWLTLFQQIERMRFLSFPHRAYAQKVMNLPE